MSIWLYLLIHNSDSWAIHKICSLNAHSGMLLCKVQKQFWLSNDPTHLLGRAHALSSHGLQITPTYLSAQTPTAHLHPIIHHPEPPESLQKVTPARTEAWLATALLTASQPAPTALIWSMQGKHTLHLKNCHTSLM